MQITLPPDLAKIVQRKVDSRLYKTPDDVVRMALEVLVEYDREDEARLKVLRDMVREADESYERGESIEFTTMEELLKEDD
ncbi:type II toxin-antitoxin system ParD family antitoxin [Sphingopyxis sp. BSNA05]|uniref:ribbon-helix-helix domain-containing protein n=1 Tax=Sphingopyxis sp. BSNA05 TaxID=1236614 RepID=UPI001C25D987|nr:type II toxin-antitoxin system ParD family antitoxin [Sphingopyxis sp. BSNA05]